VRTAAEKPPPTNPKRIESHTAGRANAREKETFDNAANNISATCPQVHRCRRGFYDARGSAVMKRPSIALVRDAVEMLVARGFAPTVKESSRHPKICWIDDKGRRCLLVISRTPSDHRTRANSLALLRRLLLTNEERPRS
jgi:hypothetical protein